MIKSLINRGRVAIVFGEMEKGSNKTIPSFEHKKIRNQLQKDGSKQSAIKKSALVKSGFSLLVS
jgi:hypothetical protein